MRIVRHLCVLCLPFWLPFWLAFSISCATDDPIDDDGPGIFELQRRGPMRGVDRAGAFTVHEARRLANQHDVLWTGVYIGGACSAGSGWTKGTLVAIAKATGWRFMPIWVGQQTSNICRHHTLTYARGLADGKAAATRMRAYGWRPDRDIPLALDVEGGTYAGGPHGSTAYVRGWVKSVHAAGYLAYVYSSELGIEHFHDANLHVDAGWVASWYFHGFHSADPATLQLGQRYRHHDRAWQYAGDFPVTGAGSIDANTADLLLAPRPGGTNVAPGGSARTIDSDPLTADDLMLADAELALEPADDGLAPDVDDLDELDEAE